MNRDRLAALLAVLICLSGGCGDDDHARRIPTPTATATGTAPPTATVTATASQAAPSPTRTPAASTTPTATVPVPSATPSASPSASPEPGPVISYFGVARADDLPLEPDFVDDAGRPVFVRVQAQGIILVVEAQRNGRVPLIDNAYDPNGGPRGIEFLVSRPLGDGSPVVCDAQEPMLGGVPGIDPPEFSDRPEVDAAIDDLGCRVNDGTGAPRGRVDVNACTRIEPSSDYGFVNRDSDLQFCLPIALAWNFAIGDTVVAARVRDVTGAVSAPREIVIRVMPSPPFECDETQGLGERTFTVTRPASRFLSSLSGTDDVSVDPWLPSALRICAGPDLGDGLHALGLRSDVILGFGLVDGTTLCAKFTARGSGGILDCDGGTPSDVLATATTGSTHIAVDTGLGVDAGTGAATVRVPATFLVLPAGSSPSDCPTRNYGTPQLSAALTTATGSAQAVDLQGGVLAEISAEGVPFDCATWRTGAGASLVLPVPAVDTNAGNVASALILSE